MSSIDRAREEVERIAKEMKQSAQDTKFSVKNATDSKFVPVFVLYSYLGIYNSSINI